MWSNYMCRATHTHTHTRTHAHTHTHTHTHTYTHTNTHTHTHILTHTQCVLLELTEIRIYLDYVICHTENLTDKIHESFQGLTDSECDFQNRLNTHYDRTLSSCTCLLQFNCCFQLLKLSSLLFVMQKQNARVEIIRNMTGILFVCLFVFKWWKEPNFR